MSYQTLYSMPCRLPCQRYMNVDTLFEGAIQLVPVPVYVNGPAAGRATGATGSRESFDGGEYEPSVSREGYEYEPTVSGESYTDVGNGANCHCGPMNRPYRMEQCGYNQSPSWDARQAFRGPVQGPAPMINESYMNPRQMMMASTTGPEGNGNPDCGCGPTNPPYRMEQCGYNLSPTWSDQATFRDVQQNRPF
jgi:hypothetical protein